MKTFKSVWLLCAFTLVFFSCQKADLTSLNSEASANRAAASLSNREASSPVSESGFDARTDGSLLSGNLLSADIINWWRGVCGQPIESDGVDTTGLTFCTRMTVPLCTSNGTTIGTVTVKTGSDKNTYITYSLIPTWYFISLNLFVGDDALIPVNNLGIVNPSRFPYIKVFRSVKQAWSYKIPGLPSYFTVAAQVTAIKVTGYVPTSTNWGNGNKDDKNDEDDDDDDDDENDNGGHGQCQQVQVAWGDGCSGSKISPLDWATKFNYLRGNCMNAEELTCSRAIHYYYDSTINGVNIVWPDVNGSGIVLDSLGVYVSGSDNGNVTVAGFNYTEAEGRAIYNTITSTNKPDSKSGFITVSTLKLSTTNYAATVDPTLGQAVIIVERWLSNKGKLSPTNLPTGNTSVRNAANYIESWIKMYTCSDRR